MTEPYDERRYAGSHFKNSAKGRCPHCGAPISHGLKGNPAKRKVPPCLKPYSPGKLATALPRAIEKHTSSGASRSGSRI